jgi:hypothetical protein
LMWCRVSPGWRSTGLAIQNLTSITYFFAA